MKSINKKGQYFENLSTLAIGIAGLAIALVVTFLIISKGRDSMSASEKCNASDASWNGTVCVGTTDNTTSIAYQSTETLASAVDEIPGWVSLIVIAVIGSVILGLVALFRR